MFVRNTWYVAAWDHEVTRTLLARTILNTPIVLYRRQDGRPVALNDACPHRFLPLSKGELIGDAIQCGYHGMTFDCDGACTRIPGQERIPDTARVASYPVAERWGWIWIWMGDPALADPDLIIDIPQLATGAWDVCRGDKMYLRGNYQLMTDNLMDPSHVSYVHRSTLGGSGEAELAVKTEVFDGLVTVSRVVPEAKPAPIFQALGNYPGNVHRWQVYKVVPPSLCIVDTGTIDSRGDDWRALDLGTDSPEKNVTIPDADERTVIYLRGYDFMTPETETTTHYFWFLLRNFGLGDKALEKRVIEQTTMAFEEDLVVCEAIQARVDNGELPRQLNVAIDKGSTQVRRMVDRMIAAEQNLAAAE
ncbi:MAG: Rieske 2Fe-2S domain-containing protein [Alphaproteobacteria bacterium]|nr:Rieske 2Fe-2S domain-containing protein [Alphaproteobacteria bacterium]